MKEWSDFFVLIGGAAATLTGLIFVGISINLNRIIAIPKLPSRASQALILLSTALVLSALCIVPGQSAFLLGIEFLFVGIIIWIVTFRIDLKILFKTDAEYKRQYLINTLFTQLSVLPYIVSGIILLLNGFSGLYWLIPGLLFSFIKAILDAWVLLVEINR
jgi:hypothetical protein